MNSKSKSFTVRQGLTRLCRACYIPLFVFVVSFLLFVPVGFNTVSNGFFGVVNVYADDPDPNYDQGGNTGSESSRILPQCGPTGSTETGSERYDLNSFLWLLILILKWIFSITGSLAVLMFVYGGYMWLLSAGEEQRVKEGRTTMINAVIGVAIILGSWLGVNVIIATLTGIQESGVGQINIGHSIAWNNVGAHCKGITEPLAFIKKTPPPSPSTPAAASAAPSGGVLNAPPPKCTDPGASPCPTGKMCDTVSGSPTHGTCIDIPASGDCNPPCTGGKICNPRTKQCEANSTGECCFTILVEDGCFDLTLVQPYFESKYLRPSTENLCTDENLINFTTRPDIFGKEKECPYKKKIINRIFCEHKKCDHMNAYAGTWVCK